MMLTNLRVARHPGESPRGGIEGSSNGQIICRYFDRGARRIGGGYGGLDRFPWSPKLCVRGEQHRPGRGCELHTVLNSRAAGSGGDFDSFFSGETIRRNLESQLPLIRAACNKGRNPQVFATTVYLNVLRRRSRVHPQFTGDLLASDDRFGSAGKIRQHIGGWYLHCIRMGGIEGGNRRRAEGPTRPFVARTIDGERGTRRSAASWGWIEYRDLSRTGVGDIGGRNHRRHLCGADEGGGSGRTVPVHHRSVHETGAADG